MNPIFLILMILVTQASPTVTVSVDRGWYSPGEQVLILIHISSLGNDAYFWLYVDAPSGRNVLFTQLYTLDETVFSVGWRIPENATEGMYTVTVTWDHQYIQTGFMVEAQPIPEFSFPLLVFLVAVASASLAVARRKTSAGAELLPLE